METGFSGEMVAFHIGFLLILFANRIACHQNINPDFDRHRKDVTLSRKSAAQFLTSRSGRVRRSSYLGEECCQEERACSLEEMEESHEHSGFSKPIPHIVNWLRKRPNCKYYYCDDASSRDPTYVCNTIPNCPDGEDEKDCAFSTYKDHRSDVSNNVRGWRNGYDLVLGLIRIRYYLSDRIVWDPYNERMDDREFYSVQRADWVKQNGFPPKIDKRTSSYNLVGLNDKTADLIFKALGCTGHNDIPKYGVRENSFGDWLVHLKCDSSASKLKDCKYSLIKSKGQAVNVAICFKPSTLELRNDVINKEWTLPKLACIQSHNSRKIKNIPTIQACQLQCEAQTYCNSFEYNKRTLLCQLSKETSTTVSKYYGQPCYVDKDHWLYSEKVKQVTRRSSGVYGAAFITGKPICYNKAMTRNEAQVICNKVKDFDHVGVPFNANDLIDVTTVGHVLSDIQCNKQDIRLSACRSGFSKNCANVAGVACLKKYAFDLECNGCKLKAMDEFVISTRQKPWTSKETNVLCMQKYGVPYGRHKEISVKGTLTKCLISDVRCKVTEHDLRRCAYQFSTKCPLKPFYHIEVECLTSKSTDLIEIIKIVDTSTGHRKTQYDSVIKALSRLESKYGHWNCTKDSTGKGINEYCATKSTLERLGNLLKPRQKKLVIPLKTNYASSVMLLDKRSKERFSDLRKQINELAVRTTKYQISLQGHFQNLSSFQRNKIELKLNKRLLPWEVTLKILFESKVNTLEVQLDELKKMAKEVNEKELAESAIDTVLSIVSSLFSFVDVFSGDSKASIAISATKASLDLFSKAKQSANKISQIKADSKRIRYFSGEMEKLTKILTKFEKNWVSKNQKLDRARVFLFNIKANKENYDETSASYFLNEFSTMGRPISAIDLNELSIILDNIVGGLCDIITGSTSSYAASAVHSESEQGLCAESKKSIGAVIKVMESINGNGVAMSDALVNLAELKLQQSSAHQLSEILKGDLKHHLHVQLSQVLSIILTKIQKRDLIDEACNKITYLNEGQEQNFCTNLKINPDRESDLDLLMGYEVRDKTINPDQRKVLIPVSASMFPNQINGTIDINELLQKKKNSEWKTSGEILFQIPGEGWMAENGWIEKGDQGPFFIKRFEIFLPPQHPKGSGYKAPFQVESKIEMLKNTVNGKEYTFDDSTIFSFKYQDNINPLFCKESQRFRPYHTCPGDKEYSVCVSQEGVLPGPFYPTTESTWKISVRSKYELPKVFSASSFHLYARIEIWSSSKRDHLGKLRGSKRRKRDRLANGPSCCPQNQYYDIKVEVKAAAENPCKPCPSGTPRIGGYFCENCPPGMEPGQDVYGCVPCRPGTYKKKSGPLKCL
ncbi:uncharacterized protein [Clytia hemisphaerica]